MRRRGEAKARWMLARLDAAGIATEAERVPGGGWGLKNPSRDDHTPEQREVLRDAFLFCAGYPRCFGTMLRLIRERRRAYCSGLEHYSDRPGEAGA